MGDQLIPGINGTLSVVELRVLRRRPLHGQEEKARHGKLFRIVALGYKCGDKIVKDPDVRVQSAISLVFAKLREI